MGDSALEACIPPSGGGRSAQWRPLRRASPRNALSLFRKILTLRWTVCDSLVAAQLTPTQGFWKPGGKAGLPTCLHIEAKGVVFSHHAQVLDSEERS